jgi:predicted negative regulator of RcsB-dependent stress response
MFICGAIVSLSAAIAVVIKIVQKAKEPEKSQNDRLEIIEKKVAKFEQFFDNDNKRLNELEKGNRVTQQALLALLSHALNGNDVDSLKEAKQRLEHHLISKEDK